MTKKEKKIYHAEWYKLNKKKCQEQQKEYRKKHKKLMQKINRKAYYNYIANPENRLKKVCRDMTCQKIRSGKMNRQPCTICGNKTTEAHHPDYNKPLEIIWLCKKCHFKQHYS